jgi:putative oxidoreductase
MGPGVWPVLPAMGFLWMGIYIVTLGSGRIGLDYWIHQWIIGEAEARK